MKGVSMPKNSRYDCAVPSPRATRLGPRGHVGSSDRVRCETAAFAANGGDSPIDDKIHHMDARGTEFPRPALC